MDFPSHWPLVAGLVLIAGFGSWVFIHSNRSYLLRWAIIPLSLLVAVASAAMYDARMGYAVAADLPARFVYLGHHVVVEQERKTGIEVWTRTAGTRLYRIPYSKAMEKALDRAREQAKGGLPVLMNERKAGKPGMKGRALADARGPRYDSNIVLPSDLDPKS